MRVSDAGRRLDASILRCDGARRWRARRVLERVGVWDRGEAVGGSAQRDRAETREIAAAKLYRGNATDSLESKLRS